MYGSKVKDSVIPEAGIQEEVSFVDVKFEETRLSFTFRQKNGALVTHSEFEANPEWNVEVQQTDTSRRVKHILNALGVEFDLEDTESFSDYANQIVNLVTQTIEGTFNVLFIYNKKGFVCLPKYPPFMERTGEKVTLKISKFNESKLIKPVPDKEPTEIESVKDPLPF